MYFCMIRRWIPDNQDSSVIQSIFQELLLLNSDQLERHNKHNTSIHTIGISGAAKPTEHSYSHPSAAPKACPTAHRQGHDSCSHSIHRWHSLQQPALTQVCPEKQAQATETEAGLLPSLPSGLTCISNSLQAVLAHCHKNQLPFSSCSQRA